MKKYLPKKLTEKMKGFEFSKPEKKFPISLTDSSYFIPSKEENKTIKPTDTMSHNPALYDYNGENGEEDFSRIAKLRKPGKDIVEVQEEAEKMQKLASEALNKDAEANILKEVEKTSKNKNVIAEVVKSVNATQNTTQNSGKSE